MSEQLVERVARLVQSASRLAEDRVRPQAARWQAERSMGLDVLREGAQLGLTGMQVPVELGGLGLPFSCKSHVGAALAEADFGFSLSLINTAGVAATLALSLPPTVAQRWLPQLLSGERIGCTALTEASAGSDFGAIQMLATPHGSGWRLQGEKRWIINAQVADVMVVYAQTQPGAGPKGIAAFVVDGTRPGFKRSDQGHTETLASLGTGGFVLDGYEVQGDEVLAAPGAAFKRAMQSINYARIYVAAMAAAMVRDSLRIALQYGQKRKTFGMYLPMHQSWRWTLTDAFIDLEAAQLMIDRANAASDSGQALEGVAAQAKVFATRMACKHLGPLQHALGAAGLSPDLALSRHVAAAQVATLVDGSTEMLMERIAMKYASGA